ncbi:MAG: Outer membrane protein assembly factor BamB, contains PQQ-like beta-propeller repeat [Candidatus Methanomarinus sp.]|nr:MAG: Outer membrane protein assembly factor BamB, contains PQQ-like beta-propeller repeat [ANME-2 cluster archaeon]
MGGIDVAPIVGDGDVYVIDYQINTPVTYSDGKVYFGNWRGTVPGTLGFGTYYCVNADNICDQKWSWAPSYGTGYYRAGAAIVGNYIIFGDDSANVTCLNKNNGTLIDYFNISRQCGCSDPVEKIRSSIVWNADDGCIYFTANYLDNAHGGYGTGHLYAVLFSAASGDLGGDNKLGGGKVYAFGDGSVIPGKQALEVKFKIQDLVDVPAGDAVSLTVTGELTTGERFEGSNTVKVITK